MPNWVDEARGATVMEAAFQKEKRRVASALGWGAPGSSVPFFVPQAGLGTFREWPNWPYF